MALRDSAAAPARPLTAVVQLFHYDDGSRANVTYDPQDQFNWSTYDDGTTWHI